MSGLDPSRVDVVLVRPARTANVAAACRALKNMGLTHLALVDPPIDLAASEARALAYGAWDVLDGARRFASLAEAVAGSAFVVGTSGREQPGAWSPRRLAGEGAARAGAGRTALVFGPEASGLRNDELALCHATLHIPTHAGHASLNLAQAVLVVAYEIRLASLESGAPAPAPAAGEERASVGALEEALGALRDGLVAIGYLNPDNPEAILAELRRLLARAGPTTREVALLRGLARQIRWAGRQIAPPPGADG